MKEERSAPGAAGRVAWLPSRGAAPGRPEGRDPPSMRSAGVRANDYRVEDGYDLVGRKRGSTRMLADRRDVACLVDANGSDPAVRLFDHIASDPSNAVRHFIIADSRRPRGRELQIRHVR